MPFLSLPITAMFPAAINMYWLTVSCIQCLTVAMLHSKYMKAQFGVSQKVMKPKIIQAAFVEEKRADNNEETNEQTTQQPLGKKPITST